MRRRRKRLMMVSALLVLFVVLLAVWVGNPSSGHNKPEVQATFSPTPTPTLGTDSAVLPTPSASPTPKPSGSGSGFNLPPVSGVQVYGPGIHTVVLRVTSNSTLAAVGYAFRNGKRGGTKRVEAKSYTITEQVEGGAPLAIVGGQVAYYGTEATCSITVDGTLRTTRTSHGAYSVVVCTA